MNEIQLELIENYKEMEKLIDAQLFTIGDAKAFLKRYGNVCLSMESLRISRDKLKEKLNKIKS